MGVRPSTSRQHGRPLHETSGVSQQKTPHSMENRLATGLGVSRARHRTAWLRASGQHESRPSEAQHGCQRQHRSLEPRGSIEQSRRQRFAGSDSRAPAAMTARPGIPEESSERRQRSSQSEGPRWSYDRDPKSRAAATGRNAGCEQQSRFLQQESAHSNPEPGADQRRRRSAISRVDPRASEQRRRPLRATIATALRRDATPHDRPDPRRVRPL